jgi:glyoxylase-like metal-dependent hydrolase (beta-lactamase superfamily II)
VCDPHLDHIDEYMQLAKSAGGPIGHIFETHIQADHRSAAQTLAKLTGANVYFHEAADVAYPHVAVRDGDEIPLGNDYVRVLHTPGHSPESACYLVGDRTRGEAPWFLLTGDTLFVGSVGRPDLPGQEASRGLASQLYQSLFEKLMSLPDDLEVYPGHFSGSACGAGMSAKPSSTLGFERRCNPALQLRSRDAFVAFVTSNLPAQPADFAELRRLNAGKE